MMRNGAPATGRGGSQYFTPHSAFRIPHWKGEAMKRWLLTPALALAVAALVHAAPQLEADPNQDYPIHPQAGPWVVVVHSYTGPDAHDLARQLVYQLRRRDHYAAYLWNFADKKRAALK